MGLHSIQFGQIAIPSVPSKHINDNAEASSSSESEGADDEDARESLRSTQKGDYKQKCFAVYLHWKVQFEGGAGQYRVQYRSAVTSIIDESLHNLTEFASNFTTVKVKMEDVLP